MPRAAQPRGAVCAELKTLRKIYKNQDKISLHKIYFYKNSIKTQWKFRMFSFGKSGTIMSAKIGLHKFNEIINGNRPFTYEMVLRSNVTGVVDAAYHPDIIFSKGDFCATIRYGSTTIGVYICNSAGNWSDTLFNTSFNTSQYETSSRP